MNKKILSNISIVIILLIMLSVSVFAFSVLSVSKVDFISNDPNIEGNSFLLTGISGYDGSGKIQASDIKDGETKATKDLYINLEDEKYSCDYSFVDARNTYIYTYYVHPDRKWYTEDCQKISLASNEFLVVGIRPYLGAQTSCIIGKATYNVGYLSQPTENFELEFNLGNGEETLQSGVISSKTVPQTYFTRGGLRYATIDWLGGGLKTGDYCPTASTTYQRALQNMGSTDFYMISDDEYTTYKNYDDNLYVALQTLVKVVNPFSFDSDLQQELDIINNRVNSFSRDNTLIGPGGKPYYLTNVPGVPEKTLELSRPFTLPIFTIRVNADWVGVVIPVGTPKIVSHSPDIVSFKSGLGKELTLGVKNIGSGAGTFKAYAECQGNIITTTDTKAIQPGQTDSMKIFFNANIVRDMSEDCKVTVIDVNTPANRDFFTIKAYSEAVLQFKDGMTSCIGDTLKISKDNNWVTKEVCTYGCLQTGSETAQCKPNPNENNNNDEDGYNAFWIISIISFVITLFAGISFFKSFKGNPWGLTAVLLLIFVVSMLVIAFLINLILSFVLGIVNVF